MLLHKLVVTEQLTIEVNDSVSVGKQFRTPRGYRDQLDRVRRWLQRVLRVGPARDVDYQDDVWAFFQNCWHLKHWLKNDPDPSIGDPIRAAIHSAVHASASLRICQGMANGTKHLRSKPAVAAEHSHVNTQITSGAETVLDCFLEDSEGKLRSARVVAQECVSEWEGILTQLGLSIEPLT
jgi:hypothetical protein